MKNITEIARKKGQCPDRIYNQINGKTPFENYKDQKQKIKDEQQKKKEKAERDAETMKMIDKKVRKQLDSEVEKLLKQIMR